MAAGRPKGIPKTGGRKPGSGNKLQVELRLRIKQFLDNNFNKIEKDFEKLEPEKRILFYEKLLNYVISKKTDITTDDKPIMQLPDIIIKTNDDREDNKQGKQATGRHTQ